MTSSLGISPLDGYGFLERRFYLIHQVVYINGFLQNLRLWRNDSIERPEVLAWLACERKRGWIINARKAYLCTDWGFEPFVPFAVVPPPQRTTARFSLSQIMVKRHLILAFQNQYSELQASSEDTLLQLTDSLQVGLSSDWHPKTCGSTGYLPLCQRTPAIWLLPILARI